jgi:hypothetical protein
MRLDTIQSSPYNSIYGMSRITIRGMSRKKKYTFYITEELDTALKLLKERDGIAEAEALRRALAEYLQRKGVFEPRKRSQAASRRGQTHRKA